VLCEVIILAILLLNQLQKIWQKFYYYTLETQITSISD